MHDNYPYLHIKVLPRCCPIDQAVQRMAQQMMAEFYLYMKSSIQNKVLITDTKHPDEQIYSSRFDFGLTHLKQCYLLKLVGGSPPSPGYLDVGVLKASHSFTIVSLTTSILVKLENRHVYPHLT